jgi:hypothetical protein
MAEERQARADEQQAEEGDSTVIAAPIVWSGLDESPILFANQFIIQHWEDDFILTAGQLTPPAILGSPEERLQQAMNVKAVPINVIVRLGLNPRRVRELIAALTENLERYERKKAQGGDE